MAHRVSPTTWHTQNFLHHRRLVERLIDMARLSERDTVLDLGAGRGVITYGLAARCRRVEAVEADPALADGLRRRFRAAPNVIVRQEDALSMRLPREPYKVFASIPFDGTARVLRRLTSATYAPQESCLVVQREAAQRIVGWPRQTLFSFCATRGSTRTSSTTSSAQTFGRRHESTWYFYDSANVGPAHSWTSRGVVPGPGHGLLRRSAGSNARVDTRVLAGSPTPPAAHALSLVCQRRPRSRPSDVQPGWHCFERLRTMQRCGTRPRC